MMRAVAVDDNEQMHELLRNSLELIGAEINLVACAKSKSEGVALIRQVDPDLLFLDIELPDGTGFDLLEELDYGKYLIVFISGYAEHGRRALEFEALDYLDKPLSINDLETALARVHRRYEQRNYAERMADLREALLNIRSERLPQRLTVSNAEGFHFLPIQDIIYFHGQTDLVTIYMSDGRKIAKATRLAHYQKQFKPYENFKGVNKKHLVNKTHIVSITTGPKLNLSNGDDIPISYQMSKEIRKELDDPGADLEGNLI